jgi:hypothetical protein
VIESKCLEPVDLSLKNPYDVSTQYVELADERTASAWYAALAQVKTFVFLDAYQLVKHYLGFVRSGAPGPKALIYLYWQPKQASHEVFARHRAEVQRFGSLVADDPTCAFCSGSYTELWAELERRPEAPPWLGEHVRTLRARYEIDVNA